MTHLLYEVSTYMERYNFPCRLVSIKHLFTNISYLVHTIYSNDVRLSGSVAWAHGNKLRVRRQPASPRRVYYRYVSPCGISSGLCHITRGYELVGWCRAVIVVIAHASLEDVPWPHWTAQWIHTPQMRTYTLRLCWRRWRIYDLLKAKVRSTPRDIYYYITHPGRLAAACAR